VGKPAARRETAERQPERRGSTAQAILDAATHLFATRGVSATSVDDIALAAGTAKGSVYYNFTSKAGLVEALMAEHSSRISASIRETSHSLTGVPLQRAVVATLLVEMQEHPDAARVLVSEVFRTDRSWLESVSTWRNALVGPLAAGEGGGAGSEGISGSGGGTAGPGGIAGPEGPEAGGADSEGGIAGPEGGAGRMAAAVIIGATLSAGLEWLVFHPDLTLDEVKEQIFRTLRLDTPPAAG
jgi:AcrR family transcriptional regulator